MNRQVLAALTALALAGCNQEVGVPLIVGGAVVTAGAYASGGIGYFRVKRCRKAVEEWERKAAAHP